MCPSLSTATPRGFAKVPMVFPLFPKEKSSFPSGENTLTFAFRESEM